MDEIQVGDTVEYCWKGYPEYCGTRGVVQDVIHGNPNNYTGSPNREYKTRYFVDWEEGSLLRKTDNLKEFWNFTVKKIKSSMLSYNPNQCGDTEEDV